MGHSKEKNKSTETFLEKKKTDGKYTGQRLK